MFLEKKKKNVFLSSKPAEIFFKLDFFIKFLWLNQIPEINLGNSNTFKIFSFLFIFLKIFELLNLQEKCTEMWTSELENKAANLTLCWNLPNWLANLKQKYRTDEILCSNSLPHGKAFYPEFHMEIMASSYWYNTFVNASVTSPAL